MAKRIMIQGTMSNVGKSLLVAGLCRIFARDGLKTAPFKSQNMALNSFITEEGLEMGRAQVMQAEAAGIRPCVDMNPILLKPTSDTGSQVIVCGQPLSDMDARTYFAYKRQLIPRIMEAFDRLDRAYDVIVIEGAGSPAEINLKADDIVNMGLAQMVQAPVLLAGDIDRGGVFAQLAGTMLLLEEEERRLVRGLIINKFRGDESLLTPGIELLKKYTDVPVIGTVPYLDLDLDDEDSLSQRLSQNDRAARAGSQKDSGSRTVCIIRLPHLSNFTDFNTLQRLKDLSVSYISSPHDPALAAADLVILPGTKNTLADLGWLQQTGLAKRIRDLAAGRIPVIGICGGFQMLGQVIRDPLQTEGGGEREGLGLLHTQTLFEEEKQMRQVRGRLPAFDGVFGPLSHAEYEAYEIHMGRTSDEKGEPLTCKQEGCVMGTYLHGLFDRAGVQEALLKCLDRSAAERGRQTSSRESQTDRQSFVDNRVFKELQYDRLADALREHLDMDAVYAILEGSRSS